MKTVSMLELRLHTTRILARVRKGERMVLTYRGKPVARLEPLSESEFDDDDTFYRLGELASCGGTPLTNSQIDDAVIGAGK